MNLIPSHSDLSCFLQRNNSEGRGEGGEGEGWEGGEVREGGKGLDRFEKAAKWAAIERKVFLFFFFSNYDQSYSLIIVLFLTFPPLLLGDGNRLPLSLPLLSLPPPPSPHRKKRRKRRRKRGEKRES